jgi:hypothetical protein
MKLTKKELEHYTNFWCRQKGIHAKDLESHPQVGDVVLLVRFRDNLWNELEKSEQGVWAALWSWTYTRKFPLKAKHLTKLETIGNAVTFRQQKQSERLATIKAMRKRLQG